MTGGFLPPAAKKDAMDATEPIRLPTTDGTAHIASRSALKDLPAWQNAFANQRKDRRFYEITEDTLDGGFEHRYMILEDAAGRVRGIQPVFLLRQDLLQGAGPAVQAWANRVRRVSPRFLTMRTVMAGCVAGEGCLDAATEPEVGWIAARLHEALRVYARKIKAPMIVLKEFPASYRTALGTFTQNGYTRVPSLPSVRLHIPFASFDEYMTGALSKATRKDLRRKFRATADAKITLQVLQDISEIVDEVYPLYLQVYQRSRLHFEKLTPRYLCRLGRDMSEKVRFFVWRLEGRAVAFSVCMLQGDEVHDEYVGLDYSVALDLHLYFYTLRDILQWAMQNGYKWYCSSGQGYEPKLHLRAELVPMDLYVTHTFWPMNLILRRILPLIEPTRGNKTLMRFANFADLRGGQ